MAENRLPHSSCCTTVASQVLRHWHKITIQWARSAPYVGFTVSFQKHDCSNSLRLMYTLWGCIAVLKDHTSWQTFMSLPTNGLMQSARHVTANVHIPWYIYCKLIVSKFWSLAGIHICILTFHIQHYATFLNRFLPISNYAKIKKIHIFIHLICKDGA